ncbi:MAG: MFS transporter, partial [Candidatus Bathyarchaeota archaeon]
LGVACLGMTLVNAPIALLAGFFSIRLLGQGSMSLSSGTLVPQWFIRKRGRALSLVSLGGAASSALLPPLNTWMIGAYGWKMGWTVWAVLLWAVMVPMAYLVIRDKPENVGLSPDGEGNRRDLVEVNPVPEESWTVREAVKTRSFWLLLFCVMVPSAIVTGLIFHHISIMGQTGIDAQAAAAVLSTMAIVRLPVVLVTGQIADRASPRLLQATSLGLLLLSMAVLLFINSVQTAVLYGVLTGIMMAFQSIVSGVIWPIYYGRRHLGSIRGLTMMAGVIGSALGPLPYGFAYDLYGGYHEAFVLSLIFPLIGVAAALLAKRPERTASSRGNSYS